MSNPSEEERDPGVPEALPRTLARLAERLGAERLDLLWIFPPLVKGRREWGLVVASCFADVSERRSLITARYTAERTGRGVSLEADISVEGAAPPDRFPRVVDGVVTRSRIELEGPRCVPIGGDRAAFDELLAEFDPALLEAVES